MALATGAASGEVAFIQENGTLSRSPLGAGTARDVLEHVIEADWAIDGSNFAVVRRDSGRARLQFPPGTTLYETTGDIFSVRISPSRDKVAFTHHPSSGHTPGLVMIVDLAGQIVAHSDTFGMIGGLAWNNEAEVWFSAGSAAEGVSVRSLALSGGSRHVLKGAGFLWLHDIDKDGRLLVTHDTQTLETAALAPGETTERDLSWFDRTALEDLTPDGQFIVFHEWGFGGKLISDDGAAYLRGTDGSDPVRLAAGSPLALSPEGRWTVINNESMAETPRITLFPSGAGEPKPLPAGAIRRYYDVWWFPDGKRILISGNERDRPRRLFVQDLSGGEPRAITPEGVVTLENAISPDGEWIAAGTDGEAMSLFPIEGGERRPIPGLSPEEYVLRWRFDGRSVFVTARDLEEIPTRIFRLDLETGKREVWKELSPADSAGVQNLVWVCLTPDGSSYAYSCFRKLSVLYLVESVR